MYCGDSLLNLVPFFYNFFFFFLPKSETFKYKEILKTWDICFKLPPTSLFWTQRFNISTIDWCFCLLLFLSYLHVISLYNLQSPRNRFKDGDVKKLAAEVLNKRISKLHFELIVFICRDLFSVFLFFSVDLCTTTPKHLSTMFSNDLPFSCFRSCYMWVFYKVLFMLDFTNVSI